MDAIALLSAGLDSTVALALAREQGSRVVAALTFDYGQRAAAQELAHARKLGAHFDVPVEPLSLPWFSTLPGTGALLRQEAALPHLGGALLDDGPTTRASADAVWVPNRNGVLIEIAAAVAEARGAGQVIVGFNREEAATFPDNSADYLNALNRSLEFSTRGKVKVISPTLSLTKAEMIPHARRLKVPLHLIWSCYRGDETPCGVCESCGRLARALESQGESFHALFSRPLP